MRRAALFAFATLLFATNAEARVEIIKWQHPDVSLVEGFRVYMSAVSGQFGSSPLDDFLVDDVAINTDGNYFRSIVIPDNVVIYVSMTAYDDQNRESINSNQMVFGLPDGDGDGVPDVTDAFPNDPTEWADSDGDNVGDNADAFPNDPSETLDSDGDGVGDNADPAPLDPTIPGAPPSGAISPYRVNAGASVEYTDPFDTLWTRDSGFYDVGVEDHLAAGIDIPGTLQDELFRIRRSGPSTGEGLSYRFPVTNGNYELKLYFVDDLAPGARVFHIDIEGARFESNFDTTGQAGAYNIEARFIDTLVNDGELEIELIHINGKQPPILSAIELVNQDEQQGEVLTPPGKPFIIEAQ